MLQLYTISEAERSFAAKEGTDALVARLRARDESFPVADILRESVV